MNTNVRNKGRIEVHIRALVDIMLTVRRSDGLGQSKVAASQIVFRDAHATGGFGLLLKPKKKPCKIS